MRIRIQNLAQVKNADIEIAPVTVITGPNNSGKTLIATKVFELLTLDLQNVAGTTLPVKPTNGRSITHEINQSHIDQIWQQYSKLLIRLVQELANGKHPNLQLDFEHIPELSVFMARSLAWRYSFGLSISKKTNSEIITAKWRAGVQLPSKLVRNCLEHAVFELLKPELNLLPSDRSAILTFRKQIENASNEEEVEDTVGPEMSNISAITTSTLKLIPSIGRRTVEELIHDISSLESGGTSIDELRKFFQRDILGGRIKEEVSSSDILFEEFGNDGDTITLNEASSSVKSLAIVEGFLSTAARTQVILSIDEPEMNLHPSRQRKFAQLIAGIARTGTHVIVTTHSDYIVRELNHITLLTKLGKKGDSVFKKYGYPSFARLEPENFRCYIMESDTSADSTLQSYVAKHIPWTLPYGLERSVFDETIDLMNDIAEAIADIAEAEG